MRGAGISQRTSRPYLWAVSKGCDSRCFRWRFDGARGRGSRHGLPLEFEGEIASARAVAEASDVESGASAARHDGGGVGGFGAVMVDVVVLQERSDV